MAAGVLIFLLGFYLLPHASAVKVDFYLLVLAPWLLLAPAIHRHMALFSQPLVRSSLALTLYLATSSLWSDNPGLVPLLDFYKQVVCIFAWLSACAWIARSYPEFFRALPAFVVWVGSGVIAATIGVYFIESGASFPRMAGLGANANPLVAATSFGIVGAMAFALGRQRYPQNTLNPYFWLAMLAYLAVVLTQSRGPIAFLAITMVATLVVYPPRRQQLLLKLGVLAVAALAIVALFPETVALIRERLFSWSHRNEIWYQAIQRFTTSPLWGEGLLEKADIVLADGFRVEHSHNSWLATLRFGGVIGLGLALWHLKTCFQDWKRLRGITPVYVWLLFGCLSALTTGSVFLAKPEWMWLFYWMPVGLICGYRTSIGDTATLHGTDTRAESAYEDETGRPLASS